MRTVYETSEHWTIAAGVAIEIMHDLKFENVQLENELNEMHLKHDDLLMDRDAIDSERAELADQCADLGAALEAAKKHIEELTADADEAVAEGAREILENYYYNEDTDWRHWNTTTARAVEILEKYQPQEAAE